ncbi:Panacea domain-containing protein [Leptolyngbya sp. FACHB-1624]|uniref:Panacea domain-containing protein n=1 Tax=Leptolyngbya sp. FACHB-1624 TaxID=2692802 RepID=UPI0039E874BD
MPTCFDVAEYFICLANNTGSFVSNLKLQKLVYYAQAWHLALNGEPLFDEDFEAWVHGPVIPSLYHEFKRFGWSPIRKDVDKGQLSVTLNNALDFLEEVSSEYFACDGYELERMTHVEEPWLRARGGIPMDVPSNAIIEKNWMKEYYGSRVESEETAF